MLPYLGSVQITEIKKDNSVTVVYNSKKPAPVRGTPSRLVLEEDLTIGTREKESGYLFEDVGAIRSDNEGNIFVLDRRACSIKVFDKAGKYMKNFGRQGQGPGEFGPPNAMHIIAGKEIMVSSIGRLSFFTLNGDFLRQIPAMIWAPPVPDSEGNIIAQMNVPAGERPRFAFEIKKYNSKMEPIILLYRLEYLIPSAGAARSPFPTLIFYAVQKDDSIVWGITNQYQLTVADKGGKIFRIIRKDYDPIKIKEEDKKRILSGRPPGGKYEFPDNYPPFRDLSVDDEGRIFLWTYESDKENDRYYDVFNSDGRYIAKITLKYAPLCWKNKKLYCVKEDEEGFLQVKRYKVTWR